MHSNDSNDRDLWQDSVDPTLIGDHSEGEKDSVVTHTQICGGDAPVEAKNGILEYSALE